MRSKNTDVVARVIGIGSLVVAILGLIGTFIYQRQAISEQQRQFVLLHSELLSVQIGRNLTDDLRITAYDFGNLGRVVQIPLLLTLSNVGEQALSVIEYELSAGDHPQASSYSGMDGGLYDQLGHKIVLPIELQPGESRKYLAYVGYLLPRKAADILTGIKKTGFIPFRMATENLGKNGIDLFGNAVTYREVQGGGSLISSDATQQMAPTIWIQTTTGRGNTFLASLKYFEPPK
jgi:hypothetical protein